MTFCRAAIGASVLALALASTAAYAADLEVLNWWTSASESKALNVFADSFKQQGGSWVNTAVTGGSATAKAAAVTRISGGTPPGAMQWSAGPSIQDLGEQGVLTSLTDLASQGDWLNKIPPILADKLSYDKNLIAVPVDLNGVNFMWYSKKAFSDAGLEPPKSWDEFFADADKLKTAGYIPIAQGGTGVQFGHLFDSVLLGTVGKDVYNKIFLDHDAATAKSQPVVDAFNNLRKLSALADSGSPNRAMTDTTDLVAHDKAALQVSGDWVKGQFVFDKKVLDTDFGCAPAPGTAGYYIVTSDVFAFPVVSDPKVIEAQKLLVSVMIDPKNQAAFNSIHGSIPARMDAYSDNLDACNKIGVSVVQSSPDNVLPGWGVAFSPDVEGQVYDLLAGFWATSSMTAEDAASQFATIISSDK